VEDCVTGTGNWRRRTAHQPAPIPRFGGRVLLVEDNPVNRAVAEQMLQRVGLDVAMATDGRAAVGALREHAFDLVLMDVQMPVMDGLDATRAIRAEQATQGVRTPIIALTANAMAGEREVCMAAGMDDFLPKPFSSHQLHQLLARWLTTLPPLTQAEAGHAAHGATRTRTLVVASEPRRFGGATVDRAVLERIRELGGLDKPDLLPKVLHLFLEDVPRHIEAIERARQRGDRSSLAASAHTLKSSSAHTGAMRLSAMCAALEIEARAGELARAETVVALEGEWRAVRSELESAMAEMVG
jgi:CheY-like chemotaxis protein/HPt (histidine-containing phosphotransfer) domain-containing protein